MRRRDFLYRTTALLAATVIPSRFLAANSGKTLRVPLGLDGYSLRGMKWKATSLIKFAAEQKLDAVLLNGLNYFKSLEDSHLLSLKELANKANMRIYVGAGGICERSASFSNEHGDAKMLLAKGIHVAKTVGSPVVNVRIGSINDRYSEGGIESRIAESIKVLKALKSRALDAGVKFGFENHAGDLRSEEVLALIQEVGTDVCGSMLDPGNALWSMEDPMQHVQTLGPYAVCSSIRDYTVWQSAEGATFQWTAIGEGLMDAPAYVNHLATQCPGVPLFVETISNSQRPIPYLEDEFWEGFPNLKAKGIIGFLRLCRQGHAMDVDKPEAGADQDEFDQQHQRSQFLKSIAYLRKHCDAGLAQP
ncbi:sugar phosphate isomerase/epimerase family protein [Bythopirellula goksoeyrii]|uniref:Xylose isomerase-like TIM barrel n=1 Tax=Bythopirellula goksoeyrii TaxID=1400387 RepID=A0A5B9QEQ8_9BACT|nr:sugar phosphate isomerase/epimerase [Bythopirellula goksoeyrii]QEG36369.1 Xylose isomerase-like TIM barrel [Bythopirellula goksoeyrii]